MLAYSIGERGRERDTRKGWEQKLLLYLAGVHTGFMGSEGTL